MMTDERLEQIEAQDRREWLPYVDELIDEIRRLRSELARYQTPCVADAAFTWSEGEVARAHREALEEEVKS